MNLMMESQVLPVQTVQLFTASGDPSESCLNVNVEEQSQIRHAVVDGESVYFHYFIYADVTGMTLIGQ